MLRQQILEEIENIPENHLPQLYNLIHDFRLHLSTSTEKLRQPGLNRGSCLFEDDFDQPLPDEFWLGD